MKYGIGLDCGISSIGYSVMQLDVNDEPFRIIRIGSRIFKQAENPKDGSSLALPRRNARGLRRRIRRHQHRIERIKYLIVKNNIISEEKLSHLFDGELSDIYMLRTKALDEPVTNEEFARILIHLAQRRGFKSNRKNESSDEESGKLLSAISDNQILMQEHNYRTVGEMFYKDDKYKQYKRNKGESYTNTVSRDMIEDEIDKIFDSQRRFNKPFANVEIEQSYKDIVLSQRPFDVGPGKGNPNSPSPYAGNQIEKMVGKCTLFPKEERAAKATYSFQCFTLWQNINNLKIENNKDSRFLDDNERTILFKLCHKSPTVTYDKIRKELNLPETYVFANLSYADKSIQEVEKKSKFEFLKFYHQIRKTLDKFKKGYISNLTVNQLDSIGEIFTKYKNDKDILNQLEKANIPKEIFDTLLNLPTFSKFGHISIKACKILIPYMEKGLKYDKACAEAGIDFHAHGLTKQKFLPANGEQLEDIVNPVVRRAVSQTIKVVNSIIREQGCSPVYINIELAREMSKNFTDRKSIEKKQALNREYNEKIKEEIKELFKTVNPTGMDIVKYKLWKEQDGICPYCQQPIILIRLFDIGYVDVDHIIPYSISFDDSYSNKVLTFSKENRQKGNRVPMQYLHGKERDNFEIWVNTNIKDFKKKKNLLKQDIKGSDLEGFKARNLIDTQYLSKVIYNYINDNLLFAEYSNGKKKHVTAVNGAITAYVRKRWGISKIREDGDLHHAVDACVISCITDSLIRRITNYTKYHEVMYLDDFEDGSVAIDKETGEVIDKFPFPYPSYRKELEARTMHNAKEVISKLNLPNYTFEDIQSVKPAFVSRVVNHKVTGQAHKDTIRSGKVDGYVITKTDLTNLKFKNGEIENYYEPESDLLLYNALKARLIEFDGDAKQAFGNGYVMHKPKSNGEQGPIVKKIKIIEKSTSNVIARGDKGVAANGSMVRIDVFKVENDGYYFVPIYVSDTVKKELPNLACSAGKTGWKKMDDKDFVFSLYSNDLVKITSSKDMKLSLKFKDSTLPENVFGKEMFLYYIKANISTVSLTFEDIDGAYKLEGVGIKKLLNIEKYVIDPIGNINKISKEKRQRFK